MQTGLQKTVYHVGGRYDPDLGLIMIEVKSNPLDLVIHVADGKLEKFKRP